MKRRLTKPGVSFFAFQDIITAVVGIFILIVILLALELVQRVEANSSIPAHDLAAIRTSIATLQAENDRMKQDIQDRSAEATASVAINPFNHETLLDELHQQARQLETELKTEQNRQDTFVDKVKRAQADETELLAAAAELEPERTRLESLEAKRKVIQDKLTRVRTINTPVFRDVTDEGRDVTLVTLSGGSIRISDAVTRKNHEWSGETRTAQFSSWMTSHSLRNRHFVIIVQPGGSDDFNELRGQLERANATFGFQLAGVSDNYHLSFEVQ